MRYKYWATTIVTKIHIRSAIGIILIKKPPIVCRIYRNSINNIQIRLANILLVFKLELNEK